LWIRAGSTFGIADHDDLFNPRSNPQSAIPMIALARKYRPKRFADLIVQDHVAAALRGAVAQGRLAHGYLFAGPRGVGKTTAARILAMALNCEHMGAAGVPGEPCGECELLPGVDRSQPRRGGAGCGQQPRRGRRAGLAAGDAAASAGHHKVTSSTKRTC
jgi:hypothetical protein